MASYYLCTAVHRPPVFPGKLVQSTDLIYKTLVGQGALLWPSDDPVVAAAALMAQARHGTRGADLNELQTVMLAGVARSLQAGSGSSPAPNATATHAAHPALARAQAQLQPLDSSGGSFTEVLPSSPDVGDVVVLEDWAPSGSGVGAHSVTLDGGTLPVQDRHTLVVSSLVTTYVLGVASGDGDGATLTLRCASNATFAKFWKVA